MRAIINELIKNDVNIINGDVYTSSQIFIHDDNYEHVFNSIKKIAKIMKLFAYKAKLKFENENIFID